MNPGGFKKTMPPYRGRVSVINKKYARCLSFFFCCNFCGTKVHLVRDFEKHE